MSIDSDIAKLTERSKSDASSIAYAVHANVRNWEAMRHEDPELAKLEIGIARCGVILATDHPSSPQYAQAQREDRRLRDQRYELWRRRAAAKRAA